MSTLGSLVIRIVGDNSAFNSTIAQTQKTLNSQTKGLQTVARSMTTVGDSMVKGITLPIIAIGAGLAKLGEDLDEAYDKIRTGTGATGKVLEGLKNDFREIAKVAPSSFKDIGTVVADLNTRLGLTGKPLQNLSIQMLNFARIAKTDINTLIPATTRVFGDWNISTDKQSKAMDFMFRATQSTGIGIDSLAQKVVQFGAPLRAMGFDFETSISLLGKWEKEGVNVETVLAGLKIGLANFAREGVTDTNAALIELIDKIKNAGSVGEATGIAMEVFGSRAGPDMAAAIREGRFDLETLLETLKNGTDTINAASDATMDWKEKLILLRNNIGIALEPLAMKVFDAIGRAVEGVTPKIEGLAKWFGNLSPAMQDNLIKWGLIAAAIPLFISGIGRATTGIIKFRNAMVTMNTAMIANPITAAIALMIADAALLGVAAKDYIDAGKAMREQTEDLVHAQESLHEAFFRSSRDNMFAIGTNKELTHSIFEHLEAVNKLAEKYPEVAKAVIETNNSLAAGKITTLEASQEIENLYQQYHNLRKGYGELPLAIAKLDEHMGENIDLSVESKLATQDHESAIVALMTQYPTLTRAEAENQIAIEEATGAIEEQSNAVSNLIKEFNDLIDTLFEGITTYNDFQESNWAVEDAQKALTEAIKEYGAGSREAEQAQNNLDDAMIANIKTAFELSQSIDATIEEQEEARMKAVELGLEYVNTGLVSVEAFLEMASQFGLTSADIIKYADDMGFVLDEETRARLVEITADATQVYETVNEVHKVLDNLNGKRVTTYVDTIYNQKILSLPGAPTKPSGALGGIFTGKEFLRPMVSAAAGMMIPKFDSGGVLAMLHPPEIVLNAREAMNVLWNMANRPVDTKQGAGNGVVMNNTFNSPKPLSESDINRNLDMMARELGYRMGLN